MSEMNYMRTGDYLIPNMQLKVTEQKELGKATSITLYNAMKEALNKFGCCHATPHKEQAQRETSNKIKEEIEVVATIEEREILVHKRRECREPSTEASGQQQLCLWRQAKVGIRQSREEAYQEAS